MIDPRPASQLLVGAFIRRAQGEGGFATVIARGDPVSGAILLWCCEKGRFSGFLERSMTANGHYRWQAAGPQTIANEQEIAEYVARRRHRDPDLWVLELDIASAERFVAETVGDD